MFTGRVLVWRISRVTGDHFAKEVEGMWFLYYQGTDVFTLFTLRIGQWLNTIFLQDTLASSYLLTSKNCELCKKIFT